MPRLTPGHPRPLAKGPTSPAIHRADSRRKRAVSVPARWSLAQTGPKRWCNHSGQSHWNRCSSPSSGLAQRNCSRGDGDCPGQGPDEIERQGRVGCDHGAGRCPQLRRRATKRGIVQLAEEGWNEARSRPANCAAGGHGRRPGAANCRPVARREITTGFRPSSRIGRFSTFPRARCRQPCRSGPAMSITSYVRCAARGRDRGSHGHSV
jgi:hypothetical protein